jgi:hypothetical protein
VSQAAFDPCRQWLGIDAVELGDPRRVIGVSPGESDPLAVLRAAESRLSLLRGLSAGPFELARNALLKRVEEAREAVLQQIAATPREAFPQPISFNMPPPPAGYAVAPPGMAVPPPPVPPVPIPPVPAAAPAWIPPVPAAAPVAQPQDFVPRSFPVWGDASHDSPAPVNGAESEPTGFAGPKVTPRYRKQSSSGGLLALIAGLAVVAAALALAVFQPKPDKEPARRPAVQDVALEERRSREPDVERADDRDGRGDAEERNRRKPRAARQPQPVEEPIDSTSDKAVSTSESPVRMEMQPTDDEVVAAASPRAVPTTRTGRNKTETTAKATADDEPVGRESPDTGEAMETPATEPGETAANAPSRPAPADDDATPTAPPAPAPGAPRPTAVSMEQKDEPDDAKLQIESMLATAYTALQRREFDTVDRTLAAAEKLASDRSSADRIARWRGFAHYAKEFFNYRDQALNSVEAGHEYDIDGKKIGVVEIDADKFIYRFKGRNKTASRDNIPSGIVLAIVSEWFDARPENQLFLGAYHLSKPECDLEAARSTWEMGQAAGADASQLLPLLDDPVIRRAAVQ